MRKSKSIITIFISVLFILSLSGCGLISKTPQAVEKSTIATVNGEKVTLADYQKRLDALVMSYENQYGQDVFTSQPEALTNVKSQLLQQMIQEKVMMQKAVELKQTVDDKTVNAEVDKEIASTIKTLGSKKTYLDQLKNAKLTEASYRASLVEEYKTNLTLKKLYDSITNQVVVTPNDIVKYYEQNHYNYTEKPDTMNVSHILVKTQAEAVKIAAEIKAGLSFVAAAKKYGTDGTKDKGGLLGDIPYTSTDYDKDFLAGAISTPTNTVSAPVKSQFGYHLIKINSRHTYKLKPINTVAAEIKKTLLDTKQKALFNTAYTTWEKASTIVQHPELIQ
jgi:foldase protein PrsA